MGRARAVPVEGLVDVGLARLGSAARPVVEEGEESVREPVGEGGEEVGEAEREGSDRGVQYHYLVRNVSVADSKGWYSTYP